MAKISKSVIKNNKSKPNIDSRKRILIKVYSTKLSSLWFQLELITNKRSGEPWRESKNFQFLWKNELEIFPLKLMNKFKHFVRFHIQFWCWTWNWEIKNILLLFKATTQMTSWLQTDAVFFTLSLKGVTEAHLIPAFSVSK